MSHFVTVDVEITSIEALKRAVEKLGYRLQSNAYCRGWSGQTQKCDYVVPLPGPYDLGFILQDKTYVPVGDFYNGHIARYLGNGQRGTRNEIGKLLQQYAVEEVLIEAQQNGMSWTTKQDEAGNIVIELTESGWTKGGW